MGTGKRVTDSEVKRIKAGCARLLALRAKDAKRYPRPVWDYAADWTGRPAKTIRRILAGKYGPTEPASPNGDDPTEPKTAPQLFPEPAAPLCESDCENDCVRAASDDVRAGTEGVRMCRDEGVRVP